MEHITEEQFNAKCQEIQGEIHEIREEQDDIRDNHLDTIEAWILVMANDINRLWKVVGGGVALIAVVIALVKLF